ncbi:protein piccolo isoform X2 [Ictalurus punctatus]|nr:protein piccolo isoform X2 [Ictalurus punctatus]
MSSALGNNLSELDRLLLELNAVQQNTPSYTSTEDAAPPLPPSSSAHYIQENGAHSGITPAARDKPLRNGTKGPEEGRPTVESLLNELEGSIPAPVPTPSGLQTEGHLDVPSEQQGRMSATSATRELDELMACLSDFKVQSNPSSLGSLNSDPLFDQPNSFATIAEINSPSATVVPTAVSPTPSLPSKPNCYSLLPSPPVPLELHIVEDSSETVLRSSALKSAPSALHSSTSISAFSSPPLSPSNPHPDRVISNSDSILSTELESLVVLSQTITATTTTEVSAITSGNQQHIPANTENLLPSKGTKSTLEFSVPIAKSQSPVSQRGNMKTSHKDNSLIIQASNEVCLVTSPEPVISPISTTVPVSESPIIQSTSPPKPPSPYITTPPISPVSVPNTSSLSALLPEPFAVTTRPLPPMRPEAPALQPSLDDAFDHHLTMNFSKPKSQNVPTSVCKMISAEHPDVFEGMLAAVNHRVVQLDMHTECEAGDGLLEDQSDCRSELLDWTDMELKLSYDGADGSMTPMTEASWMDDSLTPSSCPGTPDAQIDLPTLHPVSTMDRISASGHIKSVIRRTKETPNIHPMYRDGIIRRKMGPVIFHKSNSQDRLIEELQGKLGIARKERPKKLPDDWLTEGVIVMSNPKRSRDDHSREVDKIIIPPESPIPQRKVMPAPQSSSPAPRLPPPAMDPKSRPTPKAAPVPPPPPPTHTPPIPAPSQLPRESTPPPQLHVELEPPQVEVKPPSPGPVEPPPLPAKPAPTPPQSPPPAPVVPPKVLVSVGCQTEYNPFFSAMQIMAQGKGPNTQVNKLDNMLGSLQSDLHKLGVKTVAKGVCGACCKPIVGQVVTAMGRTWHPEHFVCSHCQEEIGSRNFFERDGQPYCERDYHHLFSPRCYYCNGPILDKVVTALDRTWHPEHFFCAQCGAFFGPEGFHEKDGKAYCRKDYFDLFAPKCGGCARAILENYISALNSLWHPECFVCRECFTPFVNGSFFEHDGQPYCEVHYHERRGSLCSGCQKPITGRCITAMGKKFHPEHFVCAFCLKQLNKGTFKEQNDKPYCHGCFVKLFS